jgi:tRNA nucleotidyltransferase (CCA-adding enzyme)
MKCYIVGGFVRDKLLGVNSKDVDLAVECSDFETMKQNLISGGIKIFLETPQYYTIRGTHKDLGAVDYVLCRKDGDYTDGRHPDSVGIGTIYDDLDRRDFTINAIAIDQDTNEYLDPHNGRADLDKKLIKAVGNPNDRFREDSLRILRALRFSIKYNFDIEPRTYHSMLDYSQNVLNLPEDRIRDELYKMFSYNTTKAIQSLQELDLLSIFDKTNLWLMPTNREK